MSKIKVRLKELRDADVQFVSLVDRSASRLPFRVIKRDPDGQVHLDLSKPGLLSRMLKGEQSLEITGIGVMDYKGVAEALTANGFDATQGEIMDDGSVLYHQSGFALLADPTGPCEGMPVKISDHMMVVVKGLDLAGVMTGDFAEMMSTRGFFGGLDQATAGLHELLLDTVYDPLATQAEMAVAVAEKVDQYKSYLTGLIRSLPEAAFKADKAIQEISMLAQKGGPGSGVYERNSENSKGSAQLSRLAKDLPDGKMKGGALHVPQGEYSDETGGYAGTIAVSEGLEKAGWTENPDGTGESGYDTAGFMQYDKDGASVMVDFSGDDVVIKPHSAAKKANDYIQSRRANMNKTQKAVIDIESHMAKAPMGYQGGADGWAAMSTVDKIKWLMDSTNTPNPASSIAKADKPANVDQKDWDAMDDEAKAKACKVEVVPAVVTEPAADVMKPVLEALSGLTTTITALTTKIEASDSAIAGLKKVVDENARKSENLAKVMGAVVVAPPAGGDRPSGGEPAQKKDADPRTGNFDTGMLRVKKRADVASGRINIE